MKFTKETLRRTMRTFIQAALSYLLVNIVAADFTQGIDTVKSVLTGLAVASAAAGIAAVMNLEEK